MAVNSSIYRRVQLQFPDHVADKLKHQVSFLGTSMSSYLYILFYKGKNKDISEKELLDYYTLLKENKFDTNLNWPITKKMLDDIKEQPRYEFDLYFYLSYLIYRELVNDKSLEKGIENITINRLVNLPIRYADIVDDLKVDYRIGFSTLINYGFSNHLYENISSSNSKKNETKTKSFSIIPNMLEKLEVPAEKRSKQIENIIESFI